MPNWSPEGRALRAWALSQLPEVARAASAREHAVHLVRCKAWAKAIEVISSHAEETDPARIEAARQLLAPLLHEASHVLGRITPDPASVETAGATSGVPSGGDRETCHACGRPVRKDEATLTVTDGPPASCHAWHRSCWRKGPNPSDQSAPYRAALAAQHARMREATAEEWEAMATVLRVMES